MSDKLKQRVTELSVALTKCLHVIEKGIEVRMGDSWPALKGPLEDAKRVAAEALGDEPQAKAKVTADDVRHEISTYRQDLVRDYDYHLQREHALQALIYKENICSLDAITEGIFGND